MRMNETHKTDEKLYVFHRERSDRRAYFGTYKLKDIAIGDINGNGEIDSMDNEYLRRAYFGTYKIK